MLTEDKHNGSIYNLVGEPVTQSQLAELLNQAYNLNLTYESKTHEEYEKERKAELGEFLGKIIAGIYDGISNGAFEVDSDFEKAAGRKHKSLSDIIKTYKS